MNMICVYILRCKGDRLYTGVTTDLTRRFAEHKGTKRGAKFTRAFTPEAIAAVWETETQGDALRLESRIKQLTRKQKEQLIETDDFSLCGDMIDKAGYRRVRRA